jgi:hypothetical protein
MRRWIHIPLSPEDRETRATWARRILAVYALVVAAVIGYSMINPATTKVARDTRDERQALVQTCPQRSEADAVTGTTPGRGPTMRETSMRETSACPPTERPGDSGTSTRQQK